MIDFVKGRIDTMLRTGHADPNYFSAGFLSQIPASKIDEIIANLKASLGAYKTLDFTPQKLVAHFEKGTDDILVHFDADYKIDSLFFRPVVLAGTLDDALKALQPPRGTVAYVITEKGRSEQLAVGSAFKLAGFGALRDPQ